MLELAGFYDEFFRLVNIEDVKSVLCKHACRALTTHKCDVILKSQCNRNVACCMPEPDRAREKGDHVVISLTWSIFLFDLNFLVMSFISSAGPFSKKISRHLSPSILLCMCVVISLS